MAFALTSPVSGVVQTGFTGPLYTIALDAAPTHLGKQYAVTGLGGTQVGVSSNSPLLPFRINMVRPAALKGISPIKSSSNQLVANNRNRWLFLCQKGGLLVPAGTTYGTLNARLEIDIPAGMETTSPAEVRAFASFFIGCLYQQSSGIGDTLCTGVV